LFTMPSCLLGIFGDIIPTILVTSFLLMNDKCLIENTWPVCSV